MTRTEAFKRANQMIDTMKNIEMTITTAAGKELTLKAHVSIKVITEQFDLDGDKFEGGKKILKDDGFQIFDGKQLISRGGLEYSLFVAKEETIRGFNGIFFSGTRNVLLSKESFEAIKAAYEKAAAEENSKDDVKAAVAREKTEKEAEELEAAKEIVKRAEAQKILPCAAALKKMQKEWSNLDNEGAEGYVPQYITKEQYDRALAIVKGGTMR